MYTKNDLLLSLIAGTLLAFTTPSILSAADAPPSRWAGVDETALLDTRSGLEWTRSDNGHDINWNRAGRYCSELRGKWRLPTADELGFIFEGNNAAGVRCGAGSRCRVSEAFRLTGDWFWSADSVGNDGSDGIELAWGVLLVNGARTQSVQTTDDGSRALCVRQSTNSRRAQLPEDNSAIALPIDQSHTAVIFSWAHHGFSHPVARLEQLSGTLSWNRRDLAGSSVEVTLPLEGLRTGDDALNRRLRGRDFFDATNYPVITFKSTEIIPKIGTGDFIVVGGLTVHGVTKPVTLRAKINQIEDAPGEGPRTGFDADGVLRRSDFGLGRYVPMVGDEIAIHITLEAHAD
jgi:polyisoprenoid-binding protein YceI